jgi:hypothetical protein
VNRKKEFEDYEEAVRYINKQPYLEELEIESVKTNT